MLESHSTKCSCSFYLEKKSSPVPPLSAAHFDGLGLETRSQAIELLRAERMRFKNVALCFQPERESSIRETTNAIALRDLERAIVDDHRRINTIVQVITNALNFENSELIIETLEDLPSLGLDSLTAAQICLRLEEELSISLSLDWFLGPERQSFARLIKPFLESCPPHP